MEVSPEAVETRVREAHEVLRALGLSSEQHGERSALTLLALLRLRPETPWDTAQNPGSTVRDVMDFMADAYQKPYAPNTRESIRKLSLKPFVDEGIAQLNHDKPGRPPQSGDTCYRIEPRTLSLLRAFGTPDWESRLRDHTREPTFTPGKLISRFQRTPYDVRLSGVRLANFRSLLDTKEIALRPLVILVGKSGSGKSSFLRFFPLLRQSYAARGGASPLTWDGEDVDFGKLSVAQRRGTGSMEVGMTFVFSASAGSPSSEVLQYTAVLAQVGGKEALCECRIDAGGHTCVLRFDADGALDMAMVDGREVIADFAAQRERGSIVPRLLDATVPSTAPWLARAAPLILDSLAGWLPEFAASIHYARPVRAAPARLHRSHEQAVEQLDPAGANLAMFLARLEPARRDEFSRWAHEHLGFHVRLRDEGQWNVEVQIEEEGRSFNLVDMGYGYSQLLPVLLQCWSSATGIAPDPVRRPPSFLAIEQPELHLHPAHQARLADVFVGASRAVAKSGGQLRLLVETHSDTLINRLGELVEEGVCRGDEVSVLLFERDPSTGDSSVKESLFDERGYLKNWPVGFFSP